MRTSVPHVTDAIQDWIERVAKIPTDDSGEEPDVCIIELGYVFTLFDLFWKDAMFLQRGFFFPSWNCVAWNASVQGLTLSQQRHRW